MRRARVAAALLMVGIAAGGCHESEVSVELTDKGVATLGVNVRLSSTFVSGGVKLAKIDPALALLKDADPLFLKTPDDATRKELEKAGVKILEQSSKRTDAEMSSKFRVQLKRLSALEAFARLRGGEEAAAGAELPKETGLHLPVDALRLSKGADGIYALEGTFPTRASVALQAGAIKDSGEGFGQALGIGMGLANDVNTFRLSASLLVPGEVVDFAPSSMGLVVSTTEPGSKTPRRNKVLYTVSMEKLGTDRVGAMKGEYIPLAFKVRFRMPKGKDLPADALWDGVPRAPKPVEAPKDPPAPPAPPAK